MSDAITIRPDGYCGEFTAQPSELFGSPAWHFTLDRMHMFSLDLDGARGLRDLLDQVIEQMEGR